MDDQQLTEEQKLEHVAVAGDELPGIQEIQEIQEIQDPGPHPLMTATVQKNYDQQAIYEAVNAIRGQLANLTVSWRLAVKGCGPLDGAGKKTHPNQIRDEIRLLGKRLEALLELAVEAEESDTGIRGPGLLEVASKELTIPTLLAKDESGQVIPLDAG